MALFRKNNKGFPSNAPPYWNEYLSHISKIPKSTLISDLEFAVIDTETTGYDYRVDVILSVGAIKIKQREINLNQSYHRYLKQNRFSRETVTIHHILKKNSEEGISSEDFLKEFLPYIGNRILVAHHANFDVKMINQITKEKVGSKLKNEVLDTATLYNRVFPRLNYGYYLNENATLDEMAEKFGIKTHDRHSSIGDAYITALSFLRLLTLLDKRGVKTWGELKKKH